LLTFLHFRQFCVRCWVLLRLIVGLLLTKIFYKMRRIAQALSSRIVRTCR
jgi:hypothetical protein